eukprot:SAG31_NODE_22_length_33849_cov_13.713096_5_plen_54_part_00
MAGVSATDPTHRGRAVRNEMMRSFIKKLMCKVMTMVEANTDGDNDDEWQSRQY